MYYVPTHHCIISYHPSIHLLSYHKLSFYFPDLLDITRATCMGIGMKLPSGEHEALINGYITEDSPHLPQECLTHLQLFSFTRLVWA